MIDYPKESIDENGYPTEGVLEWIKYYDNYQNLKTLFDVCFMELWSYPEFVIYRKEGGQERRAKLGWYSDERTATHTWDVATGGWSGNEDIIRALQENYVVWGITWQLSERGGRYVFEWVQR